MTLQELYTKVMASDELKKSFVEAAQDKDTLTAWLKEQGSDATVEQVGEFLKEKKESGEVNDSELENVAAGANIIYEHTMEAIFSVLTFGADCDKVIREEEKSRPSRRQHR